MGSLSLTDPVNGTTADASVIASNNAAIKAVVNGGIDNSNVSGSAAIAISKLAGYPSSSSVFLRGDGTWAGTSGVVYRVSTPTAVNTTTTETDLLAGTISIGANVLGTTGVLKLKAWGDALQNSGGTTATIRLKLKLGSTVLIDTGAAASIIQNSATRFPWVVEAVIANAGAANSQSASFEFRARSSTQFENTHAALTTGEGSWAAANGAGTGTDAALSAIGFNTAAVDTASSQALVLSVINPSNSASVETKLYGALAEVI